MGVRGLRMLGARRVSHAVPNRMVHGYGLSPSLVEELAALQPDLQVTVDHGIACHAGIQAAKERGWRWMCSTCWKARVMMRRPIRSARRSSLTKTFAGFSWGESGTGFSGYLAAIVSRCTTRRQISPLLFGGCEAVSIGESPAQTGVRTVSTSNCS